jgi:hypothetical protein
MTAYIRLKIQVPAAGAWFEVNQHTGELVSEEPIFYTEPGCEGDRFTRLNALEGQIFRDPLDGQRLLVARGQLPDEVAVASSARARGPGCVESSDTVRHVVAIEPFDDELEFDFPLALPLVRGFPGSPVANPGGTAPSTGLFHACASESGPLRVLHDSARCRGRALSWDPRGGLRVFDALGRDLGAFGGTSSRSVFVQYIAVDDVSGLRYAIDGVTGQLGDEPFDNQGLYFENADCTGRAVRQSSYGNFDDVIGLVIASSPAGSTTGRYVATRVVYDVEVRSRSQFSQELGEQRCSQFGPSPRLFRISTEFEPFEDEMPFTLPVPVPLRVESALEGGG